MDNGVVKGASKRFGKECLGDYPLEGSYKGNDLVLASGKGGRGGDCSTDLQLVAKGDKLTGTLNGRFSVEMTKK